MKYFHDLNHIFYQRKSVSFCKRELAGCAD